jgi:riboflavin synthase
MFTGLISNIAAVLRHRSVGDGLELTFARPTAWGDLTLGESVATDGVCLTVSALREGEYDCFLMGETLSKTTFGDELPPRVNLERAMTAADRFGGHFVSGHVDGMGRVVAIDETDGYVVSVEFPAGNEGLVMYKGSICINGVSLTVAKVQGNVLSVALIPHTLDHTTLGDLAVDSEVNLEFDMVGKYIANMMEAKQADAKG